MMGLRIKLKSGLRKCITTSFILFNLACAIIILGLAGRALDRSISRDVGELAGFQGNAATPYLVQFSLIAGALAIASYLAAFHHIKEWESGTAAAAQAAAWIAWLLLIISFCLAWKEIHIGGGRGIKLRVLEAFVIMLTFIHFVQTMLLHIGGYDDHRHNVPAAGSIALPARPGAPL